MLNLNAEFIFLSETCVFSNLSLNIERKAVFSTSVLLNSAILCLTSNYEKSQWDRRKWLAYSDLHPQITLYELNEQNIFWIYEVI